MNNIANSLRSILDSRNMTMQELSDLSGLPFETVKNLCYGKVNDPRFSTITAICKALGIYYCQLVDRHMYNEETENMIIDNYHKCGKHGKSIIELVSKTQAMAATSARDDNNIHIIDCLVPTTILSDGIYNVTCVVEKVSTAVKEAYLGYKIMTNNFIDYKFCYGDIILLEYRNPNIGEMAVFSNGINTYFRILDKEGSMWVLKPMNKQAEPIYCRRLDEWVCVGVCIDVIRV